MNTIPFLKVVGWNIYFSHNLVEKNGAGWKIKQSQKKRAENVAKIIKDMDADLLGIVECMPEDKLKFFLNHFNLNYDILMEGDAQKLNNRIIYVASIVLLCVSSSYSFPLKKEFQIYLL